MKNSLIYGYIDPKTKIKISVIPFRFIPGEKVLNGRNLKLPYPDGTNIEFITEPFNLPNPNKT